MPPSDPATNALAQVAEAGVAVWLDDLSRTLVTSGKLAELTQSHQVVGVTSNPAIFAAALADGASYADELGALVARGATAEQAMWQLMVSDVQAACDVLKPIFDATSGQDGRVSLEVDPGLADDVPATVAMAKELWSAVDRPNAMIKIPATEAGFTAIRHALAAGISVNVTLIFGLQQYTKVLDAFCSGLEDAQAASVDLSTIRSVASFFVSRVDTHVDARLDALNDSAASALRGQAGLANARLAYKEFANHAASDRWQALAKAGAHQQRPLWASTGVKDPAYPVDLYVTGLVTEGVVNTMPGATLTAVADAGTFAGETVRSNVEDADAAVAALADLGIDLHDVSVTLMSEGVAKFDQAWASLTATVADQHAALAATAGNAPQAPRSSEPPMTSAATPQPAQLDALTDSSHPSVQVTAGADRASEVTNLVDSLVQHQFASKLAAQDATLWGQAAESEAAVRLGWTQLPFTSTELIDQIHALRDDLVTAGLTRIVLCGMGGSSLAPEVIAAAHGVRLITLDTTDAERVHRVVHTGLERTVLVVASKSGSTVETDSQRRAFIAACEANDINPADRIIVVTDPDSPLSEVAKAEGYRAVFFADPTVGGRYSALSAFGLVPSGLAGANISELLSQAAAAVPALSADSPDNPALILGALMGSQGNPRNKILLTPGQGCPPGFGNWIEQLVAESTGKSEQGVLPVVLESDEAPEIAADHSDCTVIRMTDLDNAGSGQADAPTTGGLVSGSLGGLFQLWETATAVAGKLHNINPFDQPDVESAKVAARSLLKDSPQASEPTGNDTGLNLYAGQHLPDAAGNLDTALAALCDQVPADHGYLAVLAYADSDVRADLASCRSALARRIGRPVTFGWGPRYLHSTGQFHKGGPQVGAFLVITHDPALDLPVSGKEFTFSQLINSQALGDIDVLEQHGRPVLRVNVTDADAGWNHLMTALSK